MKCEDVEFGTYKCTYDIYLPWKVKFKWESEEERKPKCVSIDKCLLPEILKLWELGIKTTGCCCGHGDPDKAFIGVKEEYIEQMINMGYEVYYNSCRLDTRDSFVPKTEIKY